MLFRSSNVVVLFSTRLVIRLSEDPGVMVGVLEAGEWHRDAEAVTIPGISLSFTTLINISQSTALAYRTDRHCSGGSAL